MKLRMQSVMIWGMAASVWLMSSPAFAFPEDTSTKTNSLTATMQKAAEEKPAQDVVRSEDVQESGVAVKKEDSEIVTLRPGHRLLVRIYPDDEYIKGGDMEVNSDGNITLPLIGKVNVAGKKLVEAENMIAKLIDADYLVNPEVSIELKHDKESAPVNNSSVLVLGQVKKPGTYPIPLEVKKFTLLQAISLGGGFTEVANMKRVKIVRKVGKERETMQVNVEDIFNGSAPDIEIKNGDVIHVPESMF